MRRRERSTRSQTSTSRRGNSSSGPCCSTGSTWPCCSGTRARLVPVLINCDGSLPSATVVAERYCFYTYQSFCSQRRGGRLWVQRGVYTPGQTPPGQTPLGRHPLPGWPLQWTVRILLECILVYVYGDWPGYALGLGLLSYTDIGSRNPSPSLYNVNMFCMVQCSHWVWNPNLSSYPSQFPSM